MKLVFSPEDEAFRAEVRAFLAAELPPELAWREAMGFHNKRATVHPWQQKLHACGWAAPNWPSEFGGAGWSPIQRYIFELECGLANAPEYSLIAMSMAGPVLCRFGSPALQQEFLEPMLKGDCWFCQGFSEPQAGSDLASLRTRAVRDGDDYVITGQKIWTTDAHMADYMICLARTDPDVKPQAGLSMIIMPMDAPGVTVRPIETIDGDAHVNEVFIEEVRVPARYLIGEPNTGWTQAKYLLGHERTHNAYLGMLRRYLARIPKLIDDELNRGLPAAEAGEYRRRHARLAIDVDALEWSVLRVLAGEEGPVLGAAASAISILGAAYLLRAADLEMAILGPQVAPRFGPKDAAPLVGGAPPAAAGRTTQYLYWWAATIFGGSDEIQRNIIWSTLFR
ncbi:acyl-CoA dehydrogenase [Sphingopyxis lindanitolerans]|uniref:Acyl-CoA dehydrogenase n=1 Tax=Sphingopyxis lindanitolerans TaxID=2054227 RepID=A0A2S8B3N9_9SPHN|nr:acyl-CoA dehydrogenase family protein [Sphingopyxis lindanitolerans]PQM26960.1 acyl-CoA dehydrogenase [Sphingopyxis lindanitolerans]